MPNMTTAWWRDDQDVTTCGMRWGRRRRSGASRDDAPEQGKNELSGCFRARRGGCCSASVAWGRGWAWRHKVVVGVTTSGRGRWDRAKDLDWLQNRSDIRRGRRGAAETVCQLPRRTGQWCRGWCRGEAFRIYDRRQARTARYDHWWRSSTLGIRSLVQGAGRWWGNSRWWIVKELDVH
jgi:hypothetical protein